MTVPIGGVRVDLQLSSAAFIRDIAKTNAAIAGFSKQTASSLTGVQKSVATLNATFLGFLTVREIRKVINFTEECLKLAASIKGPLGTAARDFQDKVTAFENSFKIGVAQGFMDAVRQGLENSNVSLKQLAQAGIIVGNVLGRIFTEIVNFLSHDIPEGVKQSINAINTLIASYNSARRAREEAAMQPSALAPGAPGSSLLGQGNFSSPIPLIDTSAIESSIKTWVDLSGAVNVYGAALQTTTEGQRQMNAAAENFKDLASLSNAAWEESRTPLEKYAETVGRLNFLLKEGGIDAETYGRLNVMAATNAVEPWLDVANTIGGALGTMFKDNKAVAIAQAVINTAQAITKSLAEYGFTPIGIAASVAAAAAGAAQIATILSTEPGTGSKVMKSTGGKSAPAAAGAASTSSASNRAAPSQVITLKIQGDVFGPEHFRRIVAGINGVQRDGTALLQVA